MKKDKTHKDETKQSNLEMEQSNTCEEALAEEFIDHAQEMAELREKILTLEKEKSELLELAKRAQYDYINLKLDFDRFHKQTEEKSKTQKIDTLIDLVRKFIPFVEDLRKSLSNISDDHLQDPLTKGVQIVYNKFLQTLESMNIKAIESIGLFPDSNLHEPVSMEEVEDKEMKQKIIKEFERGFYLVQDGEKKVITTSKVVIGS